MVKRLMTEEEASSFQRFSVVSKLGRLMDTKPTLREAERCLGAWFQAKFVVADRDGGPVRLALEREELY